MNAEANKSIITAFIDAVWRRGQIDRLGEFWTPACVKHADASASNTGLTALRAYHQGFGAAFSGFSDMDMATRLRHTGPFNGVAATGRTVTLGSMRIDRIENGKIAEHWSVGDLAGLMRQLEEI